MENRENKNEFLKDIIVKENQEEKRLKNLKTLYEAEKIEEGKISNKDIDKLIEMYDKEIEELRNDTERRKKQLNYLKKNIKYF